MKFTVDLAAKIGRNALKKISKPTEITNLFLFIDYPSQKMELKL